MSEKHNKKPNKKALISIKHLKNKKFICAAFFAIGSLTILYFMGKYSPKNTLDTRLFYYLETAVNYILQLSPQEHFNYLINELLDLLFILFYTGFLLIITRALNPKLVYFVYAIAAFDTLETATIVLSLSGTLQFEGLFYLPFATTLKWLSFIFVLGGVALSLLKRRTLSF